MTLSLTIVDARFHMFKDEDFWMLAEIESHPDVMRWNIEPHKGDKAEMYRAFKEAVEKLQVEKDKIFLVGKYNGKVVGFVGVRSKNEGLKHVGEVGISVHPNHWGKGFGTSLLKAAVEKAKAEGFTKLELETIASNNAMLRIAQKVGFKVKNVGKRDALDIIFMELTFSNH
ncbi:MAG: GNAT family N-acetyltransferase [Candidatus Bathyarchaeia archaeon]